MKPFQSGTVIAAWLLRIMLAWFVYSNYFHTFTGFDLAGFDFYISAAYILFTLLVVLGGIIGKPSLTVISGLCLFVLPIVPFFRIFPEDITKSLLQYLIPLSVGFTFFTTGNNQ